MGMIRGFLWNLREEFSATTWRRMQSGAKLSPPELPQGKLQGIFNFLPSELHSILSNLLILLGEAQQFHQIGTGSEQGSIREQSSVPAEEQGIELELSVQAVIGTHFASRNCVPSVG
jgi:hypothetical protein